MGSDDGHGDDGDDDNFYGSDDDGYMTGFVEAGADCTCGPQSQCRAHHGKEL